MTTAAYSLRTEVRAELTARTLANVGAAADRRAMRAELRAASLRADWVNLLEMLTQPGRPVAAADVWAAARAGHATAAELLAAFSSRSVSGAMPAAAAQAMMHPDAVAFAAAEAVDTDRVLRCIGCSKRLTGVAHLGVTTRFGETIHYCTAACRGSFGVAR
jgi:hypothetical protein